MNGTCKMALTISPKDRTDKYNRLINIFHQDRYFLKRELRKCCKYFCLYPELDKTGRLHYHGVIKIHDSVKWFKQIMPKLKYELGFIMIKELKSFKDNLKWLVYCQKEFGTTRHILSNMKQPSDPIMIDQKYKEKQRQEMICINQRTAWARTIENYLEIAQAGTKPEKKKELILFY